MKYNYSCIYIHFILFQCLEVQPNDGFGTLLPLESLDVDVIFSPKIAQVKVLLSHLFILFNKILQSVTIQQFHVFQSFPS